MSKPKRAKPTLTTLVVRKAMTVGGRSFVTGDAFDPSLVTARRLRQMIDGRYLMDTAHKTEAEAA